MEMGSSSKMEVGKSGNMATTAAENRGEVPSSAEEAAALLGTAITKLSATNGGTFTTTLPPTGLHSSFSTVSPVPGSELYVRLASLSALLCDNEEEEEDENDNGRNEKKSNNEDTKASTSAPSILAVLLKLLQVTSHLAVTPIFIHSNKSVSMSDPNHHHHHHNSMGGVTTITNAPSANNSNNKIQLPPLRMTPPLQSHAVRSLWVKCVVRCHLLSNDLQGNYHVNLAHYIHKYIDLANTNPKSARAAGGTRIACLEVLGELAKATPKLTSNILDTMLPTCLRALKSSGSGDPTHRMTAVRAARSMVSATTEDNRKSDKFTLEAVKIMKRASEDKYSEVRFEGAKMLQDISYQLFHKMQYNPSNNNTSSEGVTSFHQSMDDALQLAMKQIDDESPAVATAWCQALAHCVIACLNEHHQRQEQSSSHHANSTNVANSDASAGDSLPTNNTGNSGGGGSGVDLASKFKAFSDARKSFQNLINYQTCSSSPKACVKFFSTAFVKAGGELSASRCGGSYSIGGRAVRTGIATIVLTFLQLWQKSEILFTQKSGSEDTAPLTDMVQEILRNMLGPTLEKQLLDVSTLSEYYSTPSKSSSASNAIHSRRVLDTTSSPYATPEKNSSSSTSSVFSAYTVGTRGKSTGDASLARFEVSRILRQGISEHASEASQLTLLRDLSLLCQIPKDDSNSMFQNPTLIFNRHQIQIIFIEISHLITTLGEAATSALEDVLPALQQALFHPDHGVRHEASIGLQAVCRAFPRAGRKIVMSSLDQITIHRDEIINLATSSASKANLAVTPTKQSRGNRFRRSNSTKQLQIQTANMEAEMIEKSLSHQYAIHGNSLAICLMLHELPHLQGGLPSEVMDILLAASKSLVHCQENELLTAFDSGAVGTCVRAGYSIISALLTMGPQHASHTAMFLPTLFSLWQKSSNFAQNGTKSFALSHEISCLDAMLISVVVFLQFCPELLLSVADALNRVTQILEKILQAILRDESAYEQFNTNSFTKSRLESAKASIMEAFAWLPPGSYPLAADDIFSFAATHIKRSTENEISSSILTCLVTSEDQLLDLTSSCRTQHYFQTGNMGSSSRCLDDHLITASSNIAHHAERESVLHKLSWNKTCRIEAYATDLFQSEILQLTQMEEDLSHTPTALHQVGTWRQPPSPSSSSKVRLLDAAIHVFAATFGLQDGHQQEDAIRMLEEMLPSSIVGSNSSAPIMRVHHNKLEKTACINIAATLLSCLQALPLHEASHDNKIGIGPPWMSRATKLFYAIFPSPAPHVRRVVAEGLALLASIGMNEDAHTLQSSILYSLDELLQTGNNINTAHSNSEVKITSRKIIQADFIRAGSIFTLGCIQRTAHNMTKKNKESRTRSRSDNAKGTNQTNPQTKDITPTMMMLTRLLPYLATHNADNESLLVRTHALHAFGLLLAYSDFEESKNDAERYQLLSKAVEIVETNFLASWTIISTDSDRGRETEKFSVEPAFLCVLLRLMTYLLPFLKILQRSDISIGSRFYRMAITIVNSSNSSPCVIAEACVFFEKLIQHLDLITRDSIIVTGTNKIVKPILPLVLSILAPDRPMALKKNDGPISSNGSATLQRAALILLHKLTELSPVRKDRLTCELIRKTNVLAHLFALMEYICGTKPFVHISPFRAISAPRVVEGKLQQNSVLDNDLESMIKKIIFVTSANRSTSKASENLLRYLLITRNIFSGDLSTDSVLSPTISDVTDDVQSYDFDEKTIVSKLNAECRAAASLVSMVGSNQPRWQVKCIAAKMTGIALSEIRSKIDKSLCDSPEFNLAAARSHLKSHREELSCHTSTINNSDRGKLPLSKVVFHLGDLTTSTCNLVIATLDNSELPSLQNAGMKLLILTVSYFGKAIDPDESKNASGQSPLLLERFSSQIIPSIKHAANANESSVEDMIAAEGRELLFFSGCEGLQLLINNGLISDPSILRRTIKPLIPRKDELDTCDFPSGSQSRIVSLRFRPSSVIENRRCALIYRIGKLWTIAELQLAFSTGNISREAMAEVWEDLVVCEEEVAVNSAAFAIDATYMKRIQNTLSDGESTEKNKMDHILLKGITFAESEDIDKSVRDAMVHTRLSLAFSSIFSLVKILSRDDLHTDKKNQLLDWLRRIIQVVIAELTNTLDLFRKATHVDIKHDYDYVPLVKDIIRCLCALTVLSRYEKFQTVIAVNDFEIVFQKVSEAIIIPLLGIPQEFMNNTSKEEKQSETFRLDHNIFHVPETFILVSEACVFMESICQLNTLGKPQKIRIIRTLLTHISCENAAVLQYEMNGKIKHEILSTCIRSMERILSMESKDTFQEVEHLARAMISFSLSLMSSNAKQETSKEVNDSSAVLLQTCLKKMTLQASEIGSLAEQAAKCKNFEAWEIFILHLNDESAMINSLENVRKSLESAVESSCHLAALNSLSQVFQHALNTERSFLIPFIMDKIGAQILQMVRVYGENRIKVNGSSNDRTVICATCVRIMMLSFQYMQSKGDSSREADSAAFVAVVFEALVSVILFNGLPNQNSSNQIGSDPQIGQLCAQTFVHLARSAPSVFKISITFLNAEDRSTLELAVRTDMNGYLPPTRVRKKLNLKGFKKS